MGPNCLFWATFRDWPTDYVGGSHSPPIAPEVNYQVCVHACVRTLSVCSCLCVRGLTFAGRLINNDSHSIMHTEGSLSNFRTTSGHSEISERPVPGRLRPRECTCQPQTAALAGLPSAMEALPEALFVWKSWDFIAPLGCRPSGSTGDY